MQLGLPLICEGEALEAGDEGWTRTLEMHCWLFASGSGSGCATGGPCCCVPVLLSSVRVLF